MEIKARIQHGANSRQFAELTNKLMKVRIVFLSDEMGAHGVIIWMKCCGQVVSGSLRTIECHGHIIRGIVGAQDRVVFPVFP